MHLAVHLHLEFFHPAGLLLQHETRESLWCDKSKEVCLEITVSYFTRGGAKKCVSEYKDFDYKDCQEK